MSQPITYLNIDQAECLSSALRCDILLGFRTLGPCGIKDVAVFLNRRPDSLYHHVRKLLDVGLLQQSGIRRVVKRDEAIYEVCSCNVLLKKTPWDKQYANAARRFIGSVVDASRAQCDDTIDDHHASPELSEQMLVRRYSLRLQPETVTELRSRLAELDEWLLAQALDEGGSFYTVLLVGVPHSIAKGRKSAK